MDFLDGRTLNVLHQGFSLALEFPGFLNLCIELLIFVQHLFPYPFSRAASDRYRFFHKYKYPQIPDI